jgi:hypothetical protein
MAQRPYRRGLSFAADTGEGREPSLRSDVLNVGDVCSDREKYHNLSQQSKHFPTVKYFGDEAQVTFAGTKPSVLQNGTLSTGAI